MLTAHRAADVRAAEQREMALLTERRRSPGALMQRAAAGVAAAALRVLGAGYGRRVLVLAGSGDNGGDALYAGARLRRRGVDVVVCATSPRGLHGEGASACHDAGARELSAPAAEALLRAGRVDLVVDGVLGIGGRPGLEGAAAGWAVACRESGVPVLAVDLPSGLEADRGDAGVATFTATRTVTFGTRRLAHLIEPAASRCGVVELVDLGLTLPPPALLAWEPDDVADALPVPGPTDHKYSRGVVGLDTGSEHYPGAALLGVLGAVHAGVGMVRYLGPAATAVTNRVPDVVTAPGRVQALVLGSGWGGVDDGPQRLDAALERVEQEGSALLLDADALTALPGWAERDGRRRPEPDRWLLTPHAGELARLLGLERARVESDPLGAVTRAADQLGATVLLKGASQYVARPGVATVELAVPGPAWTGRAGSGDVLAGICGALLAGGLPAHRAAAAGASLQAMAAHRHPGPWPPQQLVTWLPEVVSQLVAGRAGAGTPAGARDG